MNVSKGEIKSLGQEVAAEKYGHKAASIAWLDERGYRVPDTLFLPAVGVDDANWVRSSGVEIELEDELTRFEETTGVYDVAIRSSATCEDAEEESLAGRFETVQGEMTISEILDSIERVIEGLSEPRTDESSRMGVVIQKRIAARLSGIVFSSDPITQAKDRATISVTTGQGTDLAAGKVGSDDIFVSEEEGEIDITTETRTVPDSVIEELYRESKRAERTLGYPVDMEWCIDEATGELYYLQCRPITGGFNREIGLVPISEPHREQLPEPARSDRRIVRRIDAESRGVTTSEAYAAVVRIGEDEVQLPDLSRVEPSPGSDTYSLALLYPQMNSRKNGASLLTDRISTEDFIHRCQRYCTRSYPEFDTLEEHIREMVSSLGEKYWSAILVIQHISDPDYTGIIQPVEDGYVVEIGRGQFVPKGVVGTSRYVLNSGGEIINKDENIQNKRYFVTRGYVLEDHLPENAPLSVSRDIIDRILQEFEPLLDSLNSGIEFGIRRKGGSIEPYLIDFIEENDPENLTSVATTSGVISIGSHIGRFYDLTDTSEIDPTTGEVPSGNESWSPEEPKVLYYDTPDISLLNLIEHSDKEKLGFVFEKGPVLCHLATTLREYEIPAIVVDEELDVPDGEVVQIRADSGLPASRRLVLDPDRERMD